MMIALDECGYKQAVLGDQSFLSDAAHCFEFQSKSIDGLSGHTVLPSHASNTFTHCVQSAHKRPPATG